MNKDVKRKLVKILSQYKDNIENVKGSLVDFGGTKVARKHLMDAEFSIMSAMHEISWVGLKKEEELSCKTGDNPSAE
jgi:hypothetical protein